MRTTLVVLFFALTANLTLVSGQSIDEAATNGQPAHAFGMLADQDLETFAASFTERLAARRIRIDLPDENLWLSQDDQPADDQPAQESSGGSRFGGPLVMAMVVIAATTVGFVYMGIRLSR